MTSSSTLFTQLKAAAASPRTEASGFHPDRRSDSRSSTVQVSNLHLQFAIKIFHISLVYWRNTALSSLAIHTVWLRSAALSCTNIPALLIKSFYQELVSTITVGRRIVIKTCTLIRLYDAQHQYHLNQKIPKLDRTGCCCNRNTFHKARSNSCD